MEFSNLFFLYLFLPLCVGIYFLAPGIKLKNAVLILFSLLFYCINRPIYIPLLLFLSVFNYYLSLCRKYKRVVLFVTCVLNIGCLLFFKIITDLPFPLGLSFYLFSMLSYQIDVYRKSGERCKSFWHFLLFISFFPKLPMGPIVRYDSISHQLTNREVDPKSIFDGSLRFVLGLSKKLLLADPLFRTYEQFLNQQSALSAWLAAFSFTLYIYFEFSGYADMAIGLGKVFGFSLPENFHKPYSASSISEFWRRWHISLGSFFRDYVYIPLGGNRCGLLRQIMNLLIVWCLTGLWHGFQFSFVIWGMYFFLLISAEKILGLMKIRFPSILGRLFSLIFILYGWVIFSSDDPTSLIIFTIRLFSFSAASASPAFLALKNSLPLLLIGTLLSCFAPAFKEKCMEYLSGKPHRTTAFVTFCQGILILILMVLCTTSLIAATSKPSMYIGF